MDVVELSQLREYTETRRQDQILDALIETKNGREAAELLGIHERNIWAGLKRVRKQAAKHGFSPRHDLVHPVAPGQRLKGTSTLYHPEKGVAMQWVKTREDSEAQAQIMRETVEAWCEELQGKVEPVKPPKVAHDALMSLYPLGDPHIGMYSWAAETGADFDLKIAERDLCEAIDYLVDQSPPSKRAALINLGDLFHTENLEGVTSRSGHALDTDGRLHKMIDVGVRVIRRCIHRLLEKHEQVEVINAPGNHDHVLALAMSVMLRNLYENEPRLTVHDGPQMRHYIRHGKCLIGIVHGHQTKDQELPGIMATERAEDWGKTKFRYYWRGHHHHDAKKEHNGCIVEQFRTLAAGDAYAVGVGYLSGRDMKCVVMHKDYGERARFTCGIDVLRVA